MCKLIKVRQQFDDKKIKNVSEELRLNLQKSDFNISTGQRIAIAVGSRGIANIFDIINETVLFLKSKKAIPFIIPAMGSHGGANSKGQLDVLKSFGITEKSLGVPVLSSMEVVELPKGESRAKVYMDKYAFEADGVVLVNRVKPHTDYHGEFESGLVKMSVIGLGKHKGALEIHKYGLKGLTEFIPEAAKEIIKSQKILFGIGIVENSKDETALLKIIRAENFFKEEPELLKHAFKNMPHLPVDEIDILMVNELGKDISGTGLDPNITGRMRILGFPEPQKPQIKYIMASDLTPASHGNAVGVGFCDVITKKLFQKINLSAMYENVITSTFLERAKIPLIADTSQKCFDILKRASLSSNSCGEKIVRIKNTLCLEDVWVSETIFNEIKEKVIPISEYEYQFNKNGDFIEF